MSVKVERRTLKHKSFSWDRNLFQHNKNVCRYNQTGCRKCRTNRCANVEWSSEILFLRQLQGELMRTPYPYSNALLTFPLFPKYDSALVWHGADRTHGARLRHCCCQESGGERSQLLDLSAWWMRGWNVACFSNFRFQWGEGSWESLGTLFWHVFMLWRWRQLILKYISL